MLKISYQRAGAGLYHEYREAFEQTENGHRDRFETGEEPYSISILLNGLVERERPDLKYMIFATDIDKDALKKARKGVYSFQRAASLTQQLLAFSRKQILQPKVLDLNVLLKNIEKMLHRLIEEDIVLISEYDPGLGVIKADPVRIEQIVMNLAVNARDVMPRGGNFVIGTKNVSLDDDFCKNPLHPAALSKRSASFLMDDKLKPPAS